MSKFDRNRINTAEKNSAQTNKQTDRHYENNGHLAVNQLFSIQQLTSQGRKEQSVRHDFVWSTEVIFPTACLKTDALQRLYSLASK